MQGVQGPRGEALRRLLQSIPLQLHGLDFEACGRGLALLYAWRPRYGLFPMYFIVR